MLIAVLLAIVVGVSDGDTVTVLTQDQTQMKVRLSGIDAPESKQPYGQRSKQHLSDLVYGREVDLTCDKIDRYKRHICVIHVDDKDANLEQIRAGLAWHYKAYAKEQGAKERELYATEEGDARERRVGIWGNAEQVPPWEWRRRKKERDGN
jgi:endonuclease YncB( thermonuclease family)